MKDKPKPKPEPDKPRPSDDVTSIEEFGKFVGRLLNVPKHDIDERAKKFKNRKRQ